MEATDLIIRLTPLELQRWVRSGLRTFTHENMLITLPQCGEDEYAYITLPPAYRSALESGATVWALCDDIERISMGSVAETAEWRIRMESMGERWLPFEYNEALFAAEVSAGGEPASTVGDEEAAPPDEATELHNTEALLFEAEVPTDSEPAEPAGGEEVALLGDVPEIQNTEALYGAAEVPAEGEPLLAVGTEEGTLPEDASELQNEVVDASVPPQLDVQSDEPATLLAEWTDRKKNRKPRAAKQTDETTAVASPKKQSKKRGGSTGNPPEPLAVQETLL